MVGSKGLPLGDLSIFSLSWLAPTLTILTIPQASVPEWFHHDFDSASTLHPSFTGLTLW